MLDWNDLRYFLAVSRCRGTGAAAKTLGTSQSTVQRRLCEIERHFGHPVVQRLPNGYRLTALGELLLPHAERIESCIDEMERCALQADREQVGVVRITCPGLIGFLMSEAGIHDLFNEQYPSFQAEFVMCDKRIDLSSGAADIAIRAGDAVDDRLVGRMLCQAEWFVCASPRYISRHGAPTEYADLDRHRVVGFQDSVDFMRAARWLKDIAPTAKIAARVDNVIDLYLAVRAGAGVGPLPVNLARAHPDIIKVLGPIPKLHTEWRLLTLPELRQTPRVSAFFDFAAKNLSLLRNVLSKGYNPEVPKQSSPVAEAPSNVTLPALAPRPHATRP